MTEQIITIGTYRNEPRRIDLENWQNSAASDAFRGMWREWTAYQKARDDLRKQGHLTSDGIIAKLREMVLDRIVPALEKAHQATQLTANELAAVTSSLLERIERESTPRDFDLRRERRQFLREMESGARYKAVFTSPYDAAVIEQPPEMSGISQEIFDQVLTRVLENRFPGAIASAAKVAETGAIVNAAADGLRRALAEDGLGHINGKFI